MKKIKAKCVEVFVFEPSCESDEFPQIKVIAGLDEFKKISDEIVANSVREEIIDIMDKVCFWVCLAVVKHGEFQANIAIYNN